MTHCHSCGHPITGKAYPKERKVGRTVRDGKEETLLGMVFICKDCADEMDRKAKAKAMARDVGLVILGALLLAWFFEIIDLRSLLSLEARSQETGAVYRKLDFPPATAIAPTVTEPRLILIPPGER